MSETANERYHFIINPKAGNLSLARKWHSEILPFFQSQMSHFAFSFTTKRGDGIPLTRSALEKGDDVIVCLGGDGTLNEIVNGFFENGQPLNPKACVAVIPFGSGGDFARTLKLQRHYQQALQALLKASICKIDVGRVEFMDRVLPPRYFVNIANSGVVAQIMVQVNHLSRAYPALFRYLYGTKRGFQNFHTQTVRFCSDGKPAVDLPLTNILIANGRYFGRGMKVSPNAAVQDGLLDITLLKPANFWQFCRYLPALYFGSLPERTKFSETFRCRELQVDFPASMPYPFEVDGENIGSGSFRVKILPELLPFKTP